MNKLEFNISRMELLSIKDVLVGILEEGNASTRDDSLDSAIEIIDNILYGEYND